MNDPQRESVLLHDWELLLPAGIPGKFRSRGPTDLVSLDLGARATCEIGVSAAGDGRRLSVLSFFADVASSLAPRDVAPQGQVRHGSGITFDSYIVRGPARAPAELIVESYAVLWCGRLVFGQLLHLEGHPDADINRTLLLGMIARMLLPHPPAMPTIDPEKEQDLDAFPEGDEPF